MNNTSSNVSWRRRPKVDNFQALLALARDRSREGRDHLVSAVGDLFAESNTVLSDRERDIMADILKRLIRDVEMSVRRKLAQRLADAEAAPRALLIELANDAIEIAGPILMRSKVLHDVDLIEVIRHRTMEHQLAVAMRETVSAPVSAALVDGGEAVVIETLLRNHCAEIGPETMAIVVDRSRECEKFHEPLIRRKDLGLELAKRLYGWVSSALRGAIRARYDLDADMLDGALHGAIGDAVAETEPEECGAPPESLEALLSISEVAQDTLVKALRDGEVALFQMLFHKATGLPLPVLRRIMFETGGERLAIVCRAVDMAPKVFSAIYRLLRLTFEKEAGLPRGELMRAASLYLDIKPDLAEQVLDRWRRDPDFLAPIEAVTGAGTLLS